MNRVQTRQIQLQAPLECEFRLGEWHVSPALNQLRLDNGLARSLEPRLMHLLCYLAANRAQVLSRDQLTSELWPIVVVNENSLTRAISELRKQLASDTTRGVQYLQTISKRGYRLSTEIKIVNPADQQHVPFPPRRHRRHTLAVLATAASLTLATGLFLFQLPAHNSAVVPVADQTVYDRVIDTAPAYSTRLVTLNASDRGKPAAFQFTDQPQSHEKPVLSSDGTTIAFIRYDNSGSTIFLGNVDTAKPPVAVFNSKAYLSNLSWSPVGPALLFAARPLSRTAAVLGEKNIEADLMLLDLETLEATVLLDNTGSNRPAASIAEIKLT
ncbi:MAG: winged helix-turn-helix domain-containing protein [Pseudohongiellaceae bacterium]